MEAATATAEDGVDMIRDVGIHHLNLAVMEEAGWQQFTEAHDLLAEQPPAIPGLQGVYILMANATHFTYPAGGSSVFYIAWQQVWSSRLRDHRKFTLQLRSGTVEAGRRYYPRYEWAANHGAMVAWSPRPGSNSTLTPKHLESNLLREFGLAFRAPPLANSQSAW